MALADYRLCDVCEKKCFYDSNVSYNDAQDADDDHVEGMPGWTGDWRVICVECTKTHAVIVVKR
jgi:hypothetical protein